MNIVIRHIRRQHALESSCAILQSLSLSSSRERASERACERERAWQARCLHAPTEPGRQQASVWQARSAPAQGASTVVIAFQLVAQSLERKERLSRTIAETVARRDCRKVPPPTKQRERENCLAESRQAWSRRGCERVVKREREREMLEGKHASTTTTYLLLPTTPRPMSCARARSSL